MNPTTRLVELGMIFTRRVRGAFATTV